MALPVRWAVFSSWVLLAGCVLPSGDLGAVADREPEAPVNSSPFILKDATGANHHIIRDGGRRATVVMFVLTDCPISNYFAPEMAVIRKKYGPRGVSFALVHVNPKTPPAEAKAHAEVYGLEDFSLLFDPTRKLVAETGATVTPEVAVLSPTGSVLYRGRINNRYADYGVKRQVISRHDLRDALDAVLAGRVVEDKTTTAIGCLIE